MHCEYGPWNRFESEMEGSSLPFDGGGVPHVMSPRSQKKSCYITRIVYCIWMYVAPVTKTLASISVKRVWYLEHKTVEYYVRDNFFEGIINKSNFRLRLVFFRNVWDCLSFCEVVNFGKKVCHSNWEPDVWLDVEALKLLPLLCGVTNVCCTYDKSFCWMSLPFLQSLRLIIYTKNYP